MISFDINNDDHIVIPFYANTLDHDGKSDNVDNLRYPLSSGSIIEYNGYLCTIRHD